MSLDSFGIVLIKEEEEEGAALDFKRPPAICLMGEQPGLRRDNVPSWLRRNDGGIIVFRGSETPSRILQLEIQIALVGHAMKRRS